MAKYKRRSSGSWTISSTLLGWGVTGVAVLLIGFFLVGLYIGYGMGIQEGKNQIRDELRASDGEGEVSDQIAQLIDEQRTSETEGNGDQTIKNQSSGGTDTGTTESSTSGAFTEEDLGFLGKEGSAQKDTSNKSASAGSSEQLSGSSSVSDGSQSQTSQDLYTGAESSDAEKPSTNSQEMQSESTVSETEGSPYDFDRSADTEELENFFTIQTVSFQRNDYAREAAKRLREKGHSVTINKTEVDGTIYFRVRVGVFPTRNRARNYANKMQERGEIEDYWISEVTRE